MSRRGKKQILKKKKSGKYNSREKKMPLQSVLLRGKFSFLKSWEHLQGYTQECQYKEQNKVVLSIKY